MRRWLALLLVTACSGSSGPASMERDLDASLSDSGDLDASIQEGDAEELLPDGAVVVIPQGPLACDSQPDAWLIVLQGLFGSRRACDVDADCVLVEASVECSATNFHRVCDVAVRSSYLDSVQARLDARRKEFCFASQGAACSSTPDCPAAPTAHCVAGQCLAQ